MRNIFYTIILFAISTTSYAETADSINKGNEIQVVGFNCADKIINMIEWLGIGTDYRSFVVADIEEDLYKQQPDSQLLKVECTGEPEYLTGVLPNKDGISKGILSRFTIVFPVVVTVNLRGAVWELTVQQQYKAENLNTPKERALQRNFNVISSAKK